MFGKYFRTLNQHYVWTIDQQRNYTNSGGGQTPRNGFSHRGNREVPSCQSLTSALCVYTSLHYTILSTWAPLCVAHFLTKLYIDMMSGSSAGSAGMSVIVGRHFSFKINNPHSSCFILAHFSLRYNNYECTYSKAVVLISC